MVYHQLLVCRLPNVTLYPPLKMNKKSRWVVNI